MGMLKDSANGEGPDQENDPAKKEEDYEKMYMKIGRDFLHKDDFASMMKWFIRKITLISPPLAILAEVAFDWEDDSHARSRAKEYKDLLDDGIDGSEMYEDLIIFEEED